jgi:hypothetical protein
LTSDQRDARTVFIFKKNDQPIERLKQKFRSFQWFARSKIIGLFSLMVRASLRLCRQEAKRSSRG